jgi:NTP pyrophosphatase (non-canonical NTP hydrolase)
MTKNKALILAMEECGELVRACSKVLRHGTEKDPKYRKNLIEEIADVRAMLNILIESYDIDQDVVEVLENQRHLKMSKVNYE